MNVAVIGANGQLGADVVRAFRASQDTVTSLTHADRPERIRLLESVARTISSWVGSLVLRPLEWSIKAWQQRETEGCYGGLFGWDFVKDGGRVVLKRL